MKWWKCEEKDAVKAFLGELRLDELSHQMNHQVTQMIEMSNMLAKFLTSSSVLLQSFKL